MQRDIVLTEEMLGSGGQIRRLDRMMPEADSASPAALLIILAGMVGLLALAILAR